MNRRTLIRWSVSAAAAIMAHAAVGALVLRWDAVPDAAAPAATVVIELSPLIAAPEMQPSDAPPVPEQLQPEQQEIAEKDTEEARKNPDHATLDDASEPRPEPAEPALPREAVAKAEPPSQQVRITAAEEKSDVELTPLPEIRNVRPADPLRSEPERTRRRRSRARAAANPEPSRQDESKPQRRAPDRAAARPQPAPAQPAAAVQAPSNSAPRNSNALPSWRSAVIGILERNKRYPPEASARHESGTVNLAFSLNRQGRVTSARIAGSSGSAALDAETLALVRRVQPFPPPPPEAGGAVVSLIVALRYNAR